MWWFHYDIVNHLWGVPVIRIVHVLAYSSYDPKANLNLIMLRTKPLRIKLPSLSWYKNHMRQYKSYHWWCHFYELCMLHVLKAPILWLLIGESYMYVCRPHRFYTNCTHKIIFELVPLQTRWFDWHCPVATHLPHRYWRERGESLINWLNGVICNLTQHRNCLI